MIGRLGRRGDRDLIAALDGQVGATATAARLAMSMAEGAVSPRDARTRMRELEHAGDACQRRVIDIIGHSFTAPIDREDLFRVSRSVDDVLDNVRDFVREYDLFALSTDPLLADVLRVVIDGIESLHRAVDVLGDRASPTHSATVAVRKNGIRRHYQEAMAELLSQSLDTTTLKRRELLRRLDVVGLRISEAADALADGAVKRSL